MPSFWHVVAEHTSSVEVVVEVVVDVVDVEVMVIMSAVVVNATVFVGTTAKVVPAIVVVVISTLELIVVGVAGVVVSRGTTSPQSLPA